MFNYSMYNDFPRKVTKKFKENNNLLLKKKVRNLPLYYIYIIITIKYKLIHILTKKLSNL